LINDEARIFTHLEKFNWTMRSRDLHANVPFVEKNNIRLNYFQKSELKVFVSCVDFDVQVIQPLVGIHFETKKANVFDLKL
jgi:hypothetical protein